MGYKARDLTGPLRFPLRGPDYNQTLSVQTHSSLQVYVELQKPGGFQSCPLGGEVSVCASHFSPRGTQRPEST